MIRHYLSFSDNRLEQILKSFNINATYARRSLIIASIFATNFFCASELIFSKGNELLSLSIFGGVALFFVVSILLLRFKQKATSCGEKYLGTLEASFKVHISITWILYLLITINYWTPN